MLHISLAGGDFADIDATVVTIEEEALSFWSTPGLWSAPADEAVARYSLSQVLSLRFDPPAGRGSLSRPDPAHPNAYRRWTEEDETALVAAHHRGDPIDEIAVSLGRRRGAIRARLIALGLLEPAPGDRLSYPSPRAPERPRLVALRAEGRESAWAEEVGEPPEESVAEG